MNELQLMEYTGTDITNWDFDKIREWVEEGLKKYNIVYTEEKEAKNDKSELNKVKKALEDRRKGFKKECLEPYERIEPQIKELVAIIDEKMNYIGEAVNEYKAKNTEEKRKEVKEYYDRKAGELGEYADRLFEVFLKESKWLNVSYSAAKYREYILLAIAKAKNEMNEIGSCGSPFVATLLDEYASGKSINDVMKKNEELTEAARKAEIELSAPNKVHEFGNDDKKEEESVTQLTVYASKAQLDSLFDFMKATGIKYEVH